MPVSITPQRPAGHPAGHRPGPGADPTPAGGAPSGAGQTGPMPEGDTIHRTANRLAAALVGRPLVRFEARRLLRPGPARGTVIEAVEARGKHLLVRFGDGSELETHLRMTGSWHLYRPGERWRRAPGTARVVLETADWVAVCFSAPDVVLRPPPRADRPAPRPADPLGHLGPDLCAPAFGDAERAEVRRRIGLVPPDAPLVDVLLDQRVFCGVGNVYANELAHATGLHHLTPAGTVAGATWDELVDTAHRLLRANVGRVDRVTVPGGLGVYGRAGRTCRRCGSRIVRAALGRHHRATFWCPACQPDPPGPGSEPPT